jgi:hypothetical protein
MVTIKVLTGFSLSCAALLSACGGLVSGAATQNQQTSTGSWTLEDSKLADDYIKEHANAGALDDLFAVCFVKAGEGFVLPSLTLRLDAPEGGRMWFQGPSLHHEEHVSGVVSAIKKGQEENDKIADEYTLQQGMLVQVAGEDKPEVTTVDMIRTIFILDHMANIEFMNMVELETSEGLLQFKNCRFGAPQPEQD